MGTIYCLSPNCAEKTQLKNNSTKILKKQNEIFSLTSVITSISCFLPISPEAKAHNFLYLKKPILSKSKCPSALAAYVFLVTDMYLSQHSHQLLGPNTSSPLYSFSEI